MRTVGYLAAVLMLIASSGAPGDETEWSLDWYVIAAGGGLFSESNDGLWSVSGTVSQWEATEAEALAGGDWSMTGGFWSFSLDEELEFLNEIFRDRFQSDGSL